MITPEIIFAGGGTALVGMVGFFLKKTYDKFDATALAVKQLGESVDTRIDQLEKSLAVETKTTKNEITQIFQDICHERQGACSRLQEANLKAVEMTAKTACGKVERVMEDRDRRWDKQEQFNDNVKRVLYQTKDGGRSWQLKDRKNGEPE